jgi:cystathionine beta-synthase
MRSATESFLTARELLAKEGILGGSSTGTLLAAALKYCREQTTPKKVLVFVCDTGNKYLSKMYNDYWMLDNGFIERPQYGDLRDLILRPYSQRDTVVVSPTDLLTTAYQRMKLYDVSQLPVMEGDRWSASSTRATCCCTSMATRPASATRFPRPWSASWTGWT